MTRNQSGLGGAGMAYRNIGATLQKILNLVLGDEFYLNIGMLQSQAEIGRAHV